MISLPSKNKQPITVTGDTDKKLSLTIDNVRQLWDRLNNLNESLSDTIKYIDKYVKPTTSYLGANSLTGIAPIYYNGTNGEIYLNQSGIDHGSIGGLGDDDHTQYFNQIRGDSRYSLLGHTHSLDQITDPQADHTFTMANKTLTWRFVNPAGGMYFEWTGAASGHMFELNQNTGNPSAGTHLLHIAASSTNVLDLHLEAPSATSNTLMIDLSTDSNPRWVIDGSGKQSWGSGAAPVDTNLYRSAANTLKTDDAFVIGSTLDVTTIAAATTDTDKFLCHDGTTIKYRTGANLRSDIAAEPTIAGGTTGQYWRGDKTWQTLNTTAVTEGTNQYFTNARARAALSASSPISYNSGTGAFTFAHGVANNYIPKIASSSGFSASIIHENSGNIGVGTATAGYKLEVNGNLVSKTTNGYIGLFTETGSFSVGGSETGIISDKTDFTLKLGANNAIYINNNLGDSNLAVLNSNEDGTINLYANGDSYICGGALVVGPAGYGVTATRTFEVYGTAYINSTLYLNSVATATVDTDKFLVLDGSTVKYRTGAQVLSDIGGLAASSYTAADVLTKIKTVDGAGSLLDADKLDGQEGSYYLPASSYTAADVLTKIKTVDGSGSLLDADLLDAQEGAYYLSRANHTGTQAWSTLTGTPTTRSGYGITDAAPLTHGVSANYLGRATTTTAWGNSTIQDNGTRVGVGAAPDASAKLYVNGAIYSVGESHLYQGTYSDPHSGTVYALKISGGSYGSIAASGNMLLSSGKLTVNNDVQAKVFTCSPIQTATISGNTSITPTNSSIELDIDADEQTYNVTLNAGALPQGTPIIISNVYFSFTGTSWLNIIGYGGLGIELAPGRSAIFIKNALGWCCCGEGSGVI